MKKKSYMERLEIAAVAAMTGILADPEDRADERKEGETCEEAVARLAVEQAKALLWALDAEEERLVEERGEGWDEV